ncbi:YraN family protein [Methyloterricola oryzae]|uniref:YraN family protein n=1 Tax=Methyloterricola oryzae TaxID=1495050 RepID=UPI0005EB3B80|nr:YraN family protein [Methyloterricola oryzae]
MAEAREGGRSKHLVAGEQAETAALEYLKAQGLSLVERNFRCRRGEIDLVMREGSGLVFVEVRYRASSRYGSPLESIDARKRGRLVAAASHYLAVNRVDCPARFDVVALTPGPAQLELQWIKNAFQDSPT